MALTPWDDQIFDFGWDDYGPSIVQCSARNITMDDRREASARSTRPYAVNILAGGYIPQPANITVAPDGSIRWVVDLALGIGPHILYMTDAKGYTGGTSLAFEMTANTTTCTTRPWEPNELDLDIFGEAKQCGTMVVTMKNGTAPYKFQTIVGERPPKTTHWLSTQLTYVVDLGVSEKFFLVVTDAQNNTAVSKLYTVGAGQTNSCFNVAATLTVGSEDTSTYSTSVNTAALAAASSTGSPTPSSPSDKAPVSIPIIVGAAVGSVAFVALLIGIVTFLCLRRRTKKKPRSQPVDLSGDNKTHGMRPSHSVFVPFDYQPRPPSSSREEFSDYGHSSSPGARLTGDPSSQALLFGWDSATSPTNPQSIYSRGTTSSGTQWGELLSPRNTTSVPTSYSSLTPPVPPIQEKRQLVATNTSERDPTSPVAVNRLPSDAPSPPPYFVKR